MNMNSLPDDPSYDRRLTVLETRFDTILPTLATKGDIERLRADLAIGQEKLSGELRQQSEKLGVEFQKGLNDNIKWTVGIMLMMLIAFLGVHFSMINTLRGFIVSHQSSAQTPQASVGARSTPAQPPQAK
jgi:hypothetical protein